MPPLLQYLNKRRKEKHKKKETKKRIEKLKYQVTTNQKYQVEQLKNLRINNDQATAEIKEKRNEILKLNHRMEILKKELKCVKDKLCKT